MVASPPQLNPDAATLANWDLVCLSLNKDKRMLHVRQNISFQVQLHLQNRLLSYRFNSTLPYEQRL
jgi:hypothetical protein